MIKKSIISIKDSLKHSKDVFESIALGRIFIYPTDTIYGIGCDATNNKAVEKIRRIKKRHDKPLSVISPNKDWILKNCYVKKKFLPYINRLPGPFTFILKLKSRNAVAKGVTNTNTLGVRIPNNNFTKLVQRSGKPFITTSVNISGNSHLNSPSDIPWRIKRHCITIDAGKIEGRPSTIFDLTGERARIIKR